MARIRLIKCEDNEQFQFVIVSKIIFTMTVHCRYQYEKERGRHTLWNNSLSSPEERKFFGAS